MIKLNNVSFSYNKTVPVLKNINLFIDSRSAAIIGQNGAGKTTLVKLMKGLLRPDAGSIEILGGDISGRTAAQLAKTVGLVFQNPNDQIFKHSVFDEVMFGPVNIKMDRNEAKERTAQALEIVGLNNKHDMNPQDLSLSEKKLLCIASVIAMNTEIIILDEPTIAQDSRGKNKIREIINILKSENKLVMTIIHDMDFAAECFERTIVMNEGEIILDGGTKTVFSNNAILEKACVAPPYITQLASAVGMNEICLTPEGFVKDFKKSFDHH